jgi:DNA-directed RNA polymerase specialized sigma24 family protein
MIMATSAQHAGYLNLATLSDAERSAIEQHKQECLNRHESAKILANTIYSGLKKNGRIWAERELARRPDIEAATRIELNLMLRVRK